jgi:hypothetical protein
MLLKKPKKFQKRIRKIKPNDLIILKTNLLHNQTRKM